MDDVYLNLDGFDATNNTNLAPTESGCYGMFHATMDVAIRIIQDWLGASEPQAARIAHALGEPLEVPGWLQFDPNKPFPMTLHVDKPWKQGRLTSGD